MTWYQILFTQPQGNAWYILAHQWIAAELNLANNASVPPQVQNALAQAATLLTGNCSSMSASQSALATQLTGLLDEYNSGIIGPGHCPDGANTVIVYPNPANGRDEVYLQLPDYPGALDVNVKVYTTAFRKVYEEDFRQIRGSADLPLRLADKVGAPLANGLYHVIVQTPIGRWNGKLLVLR